MRPDLDPATLTPDDRTNEVAAILAVGLLRLHDRSALATPSAGQNVSETPPNELANGPQKSVTVHAG